MSSRQKFKVMNDIFEMISENDDDIKFDECGILKPVTLSKSTIVVVYDEFHHIFIINLCFIFSPMTTILILRHLNQHHPAIVIVCTHSNENRKQKCDVRNI